MKKRFQSQEAKRYAAKRARHELRQRDKRKPRSFGAPVSHGRIHNNTQAQKSPERARGFLYQQPHVTVYAPRLFSLVENDEEVLRFYAKLRQLASRRSRIMIDLGRVTRLTVDAVTVMNSIAHELVVRNGTEFLVDRPKNRATFRLLKDCGFYKYVAGAEFRTVDMTGSIRFRRCYKVESKTASELRDFAATHLFDGLVNQNWFKPKIGAVQRTLIECMSNTFGHATGSEAPVTQLVSEAIPWWSSVSCDTNSGVASFTFVDNGVGILQSGNVQLYLRMMAKFGLIDRTELLRKALHGEIPSRTKQKERGEGLPGMRIDAVERGLLHRLTIITNDVRADVNLSSYKKLSDAFEGTIVYWELNGEEPWPMST